MTGKIYITDRDQNIGKIILDNGKETKVMRFPASYESGDIAHVEFVANDPDKPLINLSAESPVLYYGSLMLPKTGEMPKPSLIVSYPVPLGLLFFQINKVKFPIDYHHRMVSFKVTKDKNGRLMAVEVAQAAKHDQYKCCNAVYGTITSGVQRAQEGYIAEVHDQAEDLNIINGVVDRFVTHRYDGAAVETGYIKVGQKGAEAYFRLDLYKQQFGKSPAIGERVFFSTTHDFYAQSRVLRFYKSSQPMLPIDKQRIVAIFGGRSYEIHMNNYMRVAKTTPKAGNIIWGYVLGGRLELAAKANETRLNFTFVPQRRPQKSLIPTIQPQQFNGFVEPDPGTIYRACVNDNGRIMAIFKAGFESLPEAIQAYKSHELNQKAKLPAIETMIKRRFSDSNISLGHLMEQRREILYNEVDRLLSTGAYHQAMDYEFRIQELSYEPKRLCGFREMPSWAEILLEKIDPIETKASSVSWDILPDSPANFTKVLSNDTAWSIDINATDGTTDPIISNAAWNTDIYEYSLEINPITPKTYYNIDI